MSISQNQKRALAKAKKRRLKRPESTFVEAKSLAMKPRERERFTQSHAAVLLKLETALVGFADSHDEVNDQTVIAVLKCGIRNTSSDDIVVREMAEFVETARTQTLGDDDEACDIWVDGMRAIYSSVETRKEMSGGDCSYLNYARQFVQNGQQKLGLK